MRTQNIIFVLSAFAFACSNSEVQPDFRPRLIAALEATIDRTIRPSTEGFEREAKALQQEASAFCTQTSTAGLVQLQDRWRTLSLAWNRLQPYNFGPLDDDPIFPSINFIESMRIRGMNYTETVRAEILLVRSSTITVDDAYIDRLTFNKVGMLALELLLFEAAADPHSTAIAEVLIDYEQHPSKCAYLTGVARLLAERATRVHRGWFEDFNATGTSYRDLMLGEELEDSSDPISVLLVGGFEYLDYVKARKLDGELDAAVADYFYENNASALDALKKTVSPEGAAVSTFLQLVAERGYSGEVAVIEMGFADAAAAVAAEDREAMKTTFVALEPTFKQRIPFALGVILGVTFTDGD